MTDQFVQTAPASIDGLGKKIDVEELTVGANVVERQRVQNFPVQLATPAVTSVAASVANVTLLASNTARRVASFYNDSTAVLYLKLGATASVTSFTVKLPAASLYELPQPVYTGIVDGVWASATGSVRVTEIAQ